MRKWRLVAVILASMIIAYVLLTLSNEEDTVTYPVSGSEFGDSSSPNQLCFNSPKIARKWASFFSVLQTYKKFHDGQLLRVNNTISEGCRTLVWACEGVCSGMGARIRAMEQVFLLAVITNRVFGIYLDDLNRKMMDLYLEPNQIDWYSAFQSAPYDSKEYITMKGSNCNSSLLSLLFSNRTYVTIFSQVGNLLHDCSQELKSYMEEIALKSAEDKAIVNGMVHNFLFKFSAPLISKAKETLDSLGLANQRYLAIHLRTGFEGLSIQESPGSTPKKILQDKKQWAVSMRCALTVADSSIKMGAPIFLATDSYNAKNWVLDQYGQRIKTVHNITIVHPDKRKSWTSADDEFLGLWIDMILLARSYVMVRAASGFSTISSELCFMAPNRIYRLPACWTKPRKSGHSREAMIPYSSLGNLIH